MDFKYILCGIKAEENKKILLGIPEEMFDLKMNRFYNLPHLCPYSPSDVYEICRNQAIEKTFHAEGPLFKSHLLRVQCDTGFCELNFYRIFANCALYIYSVTNSTI